MTTDALDDAYARLQSTGPEFDGWLSNHGPMAAEALARHGHEDEIAGWLDRYATRLDEVPTPVRRIADWPEALGDARRLGDWLGHFAHELDDRPWEQVLSTWWPRLLPGIAAGATHGVIRVGHAVRVLREDGAHPVRLAELAHGLGYWAARWRPFPAAQLPAGRPPVGEPARLLRDTVIRAVEGYVAHAHGNPVMLVHAATAPNAVLRTLPSLPPELRAMSARAGWHASAALLAAYRPAEAGAPVPVRWDRAAAFDRAAAHGDEHVIKLADTAVDVAAWTGRDDVLAAVARAAELIRRP